MAEKTNKRKVATTVTAVGMAAVLLLGGTFAWQSISQEATNIVSAAVNPGGRLHDDFDGSNDKNIYVENFGTQNIYARIKLSEYLEIGQDAGNFAEDSNRETNLASGDIEVLLGEDIDTKSTYTTYKYGDTNTSDEYWTKDWDGSTKYIPTFNKDQDSLEADLNGTYEYVNDAGENVPYGDFVDYNTAAADYSETDTEWYDADTNDSAEAHVNPDSVTAGSHEIKENQTHTLADSIDGSVISMADWDGTPGAYWVYDTDGWAYWAQAIEPGTATGLLLDSITDLGLIDEDYYYAIHVTGQFITAGDLGNTDGTGFYQNVEEAPTAEALELLGAIGVKVGGSEEDPGTGDEPAAPTMNNLILVDGEADADKEIVLFADNSVTLSIVETLNGSAVTEGSISMMQEYTGVTLTDNQNGTYTLAADGTVTDDTVVELGASAMANDVAVMDVLSVKVYTSDTPAEEEETDIFYHVILYSGDEGYGDTIPAGTTVNRFYFYDGSIEETRTDVSFMHDGTTLDLTNWTVPEPTSSLTEVYDIQVVDNSTEEVLTTYYTIIYDSTELSSEGSVGLVLDNGEQVDWIKFKHISSNSRCAISEEDMKSGDGKLRKYVPNYSEYGTEADYLYHNYSTCEICEECSSVN